MLTDLEDGSSAATASFQRWGHLRATVTTSPIRRPCPFTSRQWDAEVALYHDRARAHSPELRRFIQRDPLEYVDGANAVAYVGGRPTIAMDPTGQGLFTDDDGSIDWLAVTLPWIVVPIKVVVEPFVDACETWERATEQVRKRYSCNANALYIDVDDVKGSRCGAIAAAVNVGHSIPTPEGAGANVVTGLAGDLGLTKAGDSRK